MKNLVLLLTLFAMLSFTAYNNTFKKNYTKIELNEKTLYVGKYEVSNGDYYAFLEAVKNVPRALTVAQVYSKNWEESGELQNGEPFRDFYFSHPAYNNYPVVNVSYDGANAYCNWLSKSLSEELGKKVEARLPTKEEWLYAASGGDATMKYGWGLSELQNNRNQYYANFNYDSKPHNWITSPIDAFISNKFDLYNCSGNVSELLAEKGLCAGGNWGTPLDSIVLENSIAAYDDVSAINRGFRVVLEIED